VLKNREQVYKEAKQKRQERWSRGTRDWKAHKSVALNPMKDNQCNNNSENSVIFALATTRSAVEGFND
jgi:hypothetical protein